MVTVEEARPAAPFQSMAAGSWTADYLVCAPDLRASVSIEEGQQRCVFLPCNLRAGRHFNVSPSNKIRARSLNWIRLVFGIIYWFVWTRALPRLMGYELREEADVLADGTTVSRLVREKQY